MNRIRLGNTVFEGRNNVYVLRDDEEVALVDAGVDIPEVRDQLRDGLADLDLAFGDVDALFLTHWHFDHAGLAGEIQAESGADVYVHEADAPLVSGAERPPISDPDRRAEIFESWGIPDGPRAELEAFLDDELDIGGEPADVTAFADGDAFEAAGRTLEAVHLPGHAAGLTAYAFTGGGGDARSDTGSGGDESGRGNEEAFVGDAVLPKYTPNVGGADVRVEHPLERYVESLLRVIDRDWERAWPGHRDVIEEPTERALTILRHHRERTQRVVDVLEERGPADPWTVSADLFGGLSNIHILHGPGEAFAHLDHLAARGVAERDGTDYALIESDPDVDALFPAAAASVPGE